MKYLSTNGIAKKLDFSPKYVREKIVCRPDFPVAYRIGGGHRRWLESDVDLYVRRYREGSAIVSQT